MSVLTSLTCDVDEDDLTLNTSYATFFKKELGRYDKKE